jgi:predicted phage tail protein
LLVAPAANALVTTSTVKLDWSNVTIPTGTTFQKYEVQIATNSTFTTGMTLTDAAISEFTFGPLTPNTRYYWRVRTYNTLGQYGAWSLVRTFRAAILPPNTLTPGAVVPNPYEQLLTRRPSFTWDAVTGATGYTLEVSTATTFATKAISKSVTGVNTYTHTADLAANTVYFWRLKANGPNGPSLYSQVRTFRTANPPSVPTLSAPAADALVTTTSPLFDWANSAIPAGTTFRWYEIQVDTSNTFGTAVSATTNEFDLNNSQFTPTLLNGKTYYWRVRSVNIAGEFSGWSLVRSLRVAYAKPTLLAPSGSILTLKPTFTWNPTTGATSYSFQVSKNSTFTLLVITKTVYAATYTHATNLTAGTTYYWRVRVNGAYGPSAWSDYFTFTTP